MHKQKLVHARTQGKGAVTPQETDPDLPMVVWESRRRCGWPAAGLGALRVAVRAWDLLREVSIIFITSTTVWKKIFANYLSSKVLISIVHKESRNEMTT